MSVRPRFSASTCCATYYPLFPASSAPCVTPLNAPWRFVCAYCAAVQLAIFAGVRGKAGILAMKLLYVLFVFAVRGPLGYI